MVQYTMDTIHFGSDKNELADRFIFLNNYRCIDVSKLYDASSIFAAVFNSWVRRHKWQRQFMVKFCFFSKFFSECCCRANLGPHRRHKRNKTYGNSIEPLFVNRLFFRRHCSITGAISRCSSVSWIFSWFVANLNDDYDVVCARW